MQAANCNPTKWNPSRIFGVLLTFFLLATLQGEERVDVAQRYLDENRISDQTFVRPVNYGEIHAKITSSHDPQTKFHPYIFNLSNPKSKVLSLEQRENIQALIEQRKNRPVQWHDVRNTVRVQAQLVLWSYAIERDDQQASNLEKEWNRWNDLRLAYMFEEFVETERFQRDVWAIFTTEQKQRLIAGDWDAYIKKNTGHSRAFTAHKQVVKALGKPPNKTEFDRAVIEWERKWQPVSTEIEASAKFERQRELSMDESNEAFAVAAWMEQETAFRIFSLAERDAIRELVSAGYPSANDLKSTIATYQEKLRLEMIEKYREHAGELLKGLGELK